MLEQQKLPKNFDEQIGLKRISKLLSIFKHFRKDIDIVGSIYYPRILYKNELLHTHINNFNLSFLDTPAINKDNTVIKTVKINYLTLIDQDWFNNYLNTYGTSKVFFINYKNTNLYVSDVKIRSIGLHGLDPQENYLCFSKYHKKFFFSKDEAIKFLTKFKDVNLQIT